MVPIICRGCKRVGLFDLAFVAALTDDDACADCGSNDLDVFEGARPPGNVFQVGGDAIFDTIEGNQVGTFGADGTAQIGTASARVADLDVDMPMDILDAARPVTETVRCSSCLTEFEHTATDPADPLPACPQCGSTATSVAGATDTTTARHARLMRTLGHSGARTSPEAKVAEITAGILHTNPGMTHEAAYALAAKTVQQFPQVVAR